VSQPKYHGEVILRHNGNTKIAFTISASILVSLLLVWPSISASLPSASKTMTFEGVMSYVWTNVTIDTSKTLGQNELSLGFMLDPDWSWWLGNSNRRELARNASFKLIRLFDWKTKSPRPCISWNDTTRTGAFNWSTIDLIVQRILEIGAEPIFCLGGISGGSFCGPPDMGIDPGTSLPYPESWAAYCTQWVQHFKTTSLPVRYYEIVNEPYFFFGWTDMTKLGNYVTLWNTAARSMRQANSGVLLSQDSIMFTSVLNYWLQYGDDIDFLDFHKYDCYTTEETGLYDNDTMFQRAETYHYDIIDGARTKWFNSRGKLLPVIDSESGFSSSWVNGTDPRIQQMAGAVWTALSLRTAALKDVDYNIYYCYASSALYGQPSPTGGFGFGMINSDNNKPWYPYYVNWMFGNNLAVGDTFLASNSTSEGIRCLVWTHNGMTNVLIISKTLQRSDILIQGLSGSARYFKIDERISWQTASMQTGTVDLQSILILFGYTVLLLQTPA
jgi:hypothetical protein